MTAFIAKQMLGNQLDSVKGALGDKDKDSNKSDDEEEAELLEAKREEEERRKEKYRKIEEEREKMRQDIRNKYGIKKKENIDLSCDPGMEGRLGRKKNPMDGENEEGNVDSEGENNIIPKSLNELTIRINQLPSRIITSVNEATSRCIIQ